LSAFNISAFASVASRPPLMAMGTTRSASSIRIQRGDCLCTISQSIFGSQKYALAIWKYNNDNGNRISDPNMIFEGKNLLIPSEKELESYFSQNLAGYYKNESARTGIFCPLETLPTRFSGKVNITDYISGQELSSLGVDDPSEMICAMQAFANQESGGDPGLVNKHSGAMGLFQIMPFNWAPWAKEAGLGSNAPTTVENQVHVAAFKMSQYYKKFKNMDDVFAAWYGGERAVQRQHDTGTYDTRDKAYTKMKDGTKYPTIDDYVAQVRKKKLEQQYLLAQKEQKAA